ncbi:MAG: hypothetical protein ACKVVT_07655 [Dehalococcoidia bacterium]
MTTAASIADILGAPAIEPIHLRQALDILDGTATIHDFGRPRSLFARSQRAETSGAVRALAQQWWERLGGDHQATLDPAARAELEDELRRATDGLSES